MIKQSKPYIVGMLRNEKLLKAAGIIDCNDKTVFMFIDDNSKLVTHNMKTVNRIVKNQPQFNGFVS